MLLVFQLQKLQLLVKTIETLDFFVVEFRKKITLRVGFLLSPKFGWCLIYRSRVRKSNFFSNFINSNFWSKHSYIHSISFHFSPFQSISFHFIPCHSMSFHVIPFHSISFLHSMIASITLVNEVKYNTRGMTNLNSN